MVRGGTKESGEGSVGAGEGLLVGFGLGQREEMLPTSSAVDLQLQYGIGKGIFLDFTALPGPFLVAFKFFGDVLAVAVELMLKQMLQDIRAHAFCVFLPTVI
jgi:hypothetical protein